MVSTAGLLQQRDYLNDLMSRTTNQQLHEELFRKLAKTNEQLQGVRY